MSMPASTNTWRIHPEYGITSEDQNRGDILLMLCETEINELPKIREYISEHGLGNIDIESKSFIIEDTPLTAAACYNHADIVKFLVRECGADVNAQNGRGGTALHYAAINESPSMIKILLKLGADPTLKNNDEFTPVDISYYRYNDECARLMKSYQTPVKSANKS